MTAEEYLNKNCKLEDWDRLEEGLKDSMLTNNVIEYMEQYAELRIKDFVGQSEQCCSPPEPYYLGTTCPKCKKPFRRVNS